MISISDIDQGHRFVKRIPTAGRDNAGKPLNGKGICASAVTKRIYVSTIKTLQAIDLDTEKLIWERAYDNRDSYGRKNRRPLLGQHPSVHHQWSSNTLLRMLQRTAGI